MREVERGISAHREGKMASSSLGWLGTGHEAFNPNNEGSTEFRSAARSRSAVERTVHMYATDRRLATGAEVRWPASVKGRCRKLLSGIPGRLGASRGLSVECIMALVTTRDKMGNSKLGNR